jgi:alanine-alpha-ketoisovalerate/valine-pyruvate aminotransferase
MGYSLHNLKACVRDSPAFIATPQGVRISYLWLNKSDFASTELVEELKVLGISSEVGWFV